MIQEKKKTGLASMTPEKRREIAQAGGKAVSADKQHMRTIGIKGAQARWGAPEKKETVNG